MRKVLNGSGGTGNGWWLNGYLYGIFEKKIGQVSVWWIWSYGTGLRAERLRWPLFRPPPGGYLFIKPESGSELVGASMMAINLHLIMLGSDRVKPGDVKSKTNI